MIEVARLATLAVAVLVSLAGMSAYGQEEPTSESTPPVLTPVGEGKPAATKIPATAPPVGGPVVNIHFVPRRSLDTAEKELVASWNKIRSLTAKITLTVDYKDEQEGRHDGTGMLDCMKKNGKLFMKTRSYSSILIEQPEGKRLLTGMRLNKVSDGEFVFTVEERYESMVATKTWAIPPHIRAVGGVDLFVRMHRAGRVTLLPDEVINGRDVYVFEVRVTGDAVVTRHHVCKETGVRLYFEMKRLDGNLTFTYALSELEINPEFSEDHFTFVPPDGVEVQDLTQGGNRVKPAADGR